MKRISDVENINMGFQIAPMIDVVFVIMLFFMVMAGAVKIERELKTTLPGIKAMQPTEDELPQEITIVISEDGVVTMNDEEFDNTPDPKVAKALPELTANLVLQKKEADAGGRKVLVTLQTDEQAKYSRVIDVLNSLAKARIENVTFTVGSEQ
jgi:biopolymer transport protein ExbD